MSHQPMISVGIDVSRDDLAVAYLRPDGSVREKVYGNDEKGCRKLVASFKKHGVAKTTPCIIESTGDFHLLSALT